MVKIIKAYAYYLITLFWDSFGIASINLFDFGKDLCVSKMWLWAEQGSHLSFRGTKVKP